MAKTLKPLIFLKEGDKVDYQTMIEEIVGQWLSELDCYDSNSDCHLDHDKSGYDKGRAWFISKHDYEISVKKIVKTKKATPTNPLTKNKNRTR